MLEHELSTIGLLFLFSIIGGMIAVRLRQPAVIGLLLVGIIIGPNFLNLIHDETIIKMLEEIGTILLLFVIGMEFVISKLLKIGTKALLIGALKIGIMTFLTFEVFVLLGFSQTVALIFGVMLSMSSTVVIVKVLESKGLYQREEMPLLIGALIVEDIFAVIVMTFLSNVSGSADAISIIQRIIFSLTIIIILYLVAIKLSKILIPLLVKQGDEEIITFIGLGICAGFSFLAFQLGLGPATGAFLAGSVVASLRDVKKFEHAVKPYTLMFSSLFFIAIGTMVDLSVITQHFWLLIALLILVGVSQFLAIGVMSYLFANFNRQQMIFSSIAMLPIGEFSLLIGQAAMKLDLGIDFVSIVAILIFSTALIMSLVVSYHKQVTDFLITSPKSVSHAPRSFSHFVRDLISELDSDNSNARSFKKGLLIFSMHLLLMVFAFLIWRKLESPSIYAFWIMTSAFLAMELILGFMAYRHGKTSFRLLSQMIANIFSFTSLKKSDNVLRSLLFAVFCLFMTIYSPALIVLFKMPKFLNIISFVMLIAMMFWFRKLFSVIHKASFSTSHHSHKKVRLSRLPISPY
jgi:monovalent cation:H+ antiporter-2, CPA2 family